jgi:hypothetical protein
MPLRLPTMAPTSAEERAMRRNNNAGYTAEATVTSIACDLVLLTAQTSDNLAFHLSPPLLPAAGCGAKLRRRANAQLVRP